jgi:hypothetical protein
MQQTTNVDLLLLLKEKSLQGAYHVDKVPVVTSANKESKVFFLLYDAMSVFRRLELINILSESGWGGSTLVSTFKIPDFKKAVEVGGIDYIIQGRLGEMRQTDIYSGYMKGIPGAKVWEGKILKYDATGSSFRSYFVKEFSSLSDPLTSELIHSMA